MTEIVLMTEAEAARAAAPVEEAGLGCIRTVRGNLPLDSVDIRADVTGLTSRVELTQGFVNSFDTPLEATYVFPMPDRAAVTRMRMTAAGHVVEAELKERAQARADYDRAMAAGQRASIAEEERPDVFTMRVGNILPGERVTVALTLVAPLSYEDGTATVRFPLVVAPRYIPGTPLPGDAVGDGYAVDTDAVPDASRITPPVLLPGFPNPVRLSIEVGLDPAGLELTEVRSSLPAVRDDASPGRIAVRPGERLDRDFVLRLRYGAAELSDALVLVPDDSGGSGAASTGEGTFQLTVLPPAETGPARPRDVVLVLDRSGSMEGWKMVAARRAAARIVDTLTTHDRFAVLSFDDRVEHPDGLPAGLVPATDRHRYRAVEHLARVDARGGTELLAPLREALSLLSPTSVPSPAEGRDPVLVLVTDGQVGNEDHILSQLTGQLRRVRVHTVGIDQAVNAGFLGRLAGIGGGRCELVESEDRLDEAMAAIHRRIAAPVVTRLELVPDGAAPDRAALDGAAPDGAAPDRAAPDLVLIADSLAPARVPDLFPGVALVVAGRYRGTGGTLTLRGTTRDGRPWSRTVTGQRRDAPAVTAQWARAHLRDLEDRYVADVGGSGAALEKRIVDTSLRFGVLCRFTAYVAVDSRVVAEGGERHRVVQPVESPAGWDMLRGPVVRRLMLDEAMLPPPAPGGWAGPPPAPRSPAPAQAAAPMASAKLYRGAMELSEEAEADAPVPTDLDAAREQAGDELRRLHEAAGRPAHERWELLADLASRLHALVRHLSQRGIAPAAYAPLGDLAARLDAGGELESLWTRAVEVLAELTGESQPRSRRPFWKRT
jgi:hypothetical protein